jgi:hypothetical protein
MGIGISGRDFLNIRILSLIALECILRGAGYCAISSSGDRDRFFISGVMFSVYVLVTTVQGVHPVHGTHLFSVPKLIWPLSS